MTVVINGTTGITSPAETVAGDSTFNGVTVGRGAGSVATNTAVGASALSANTTGGANTTIGYQAGKSNTTANEITAVGYNALALNSTGQFNSAVGAYCLDSNTTGTYNTAIGDSALHSNTTASNNTAVGYQSLYTTSTGEANTAIGYLSLKNSTASYGVGLGMYAGQNCTANGITAVGFAAASTATAASNIVAVGFQALTANTTGGSNTAVGYLAGSAITSGFNNTFLGYSAGSNAVTNAGGIYIGYLTQASSTNVLRELVLGYNTTGKGQDTAYIGTGAAYQGNNSAAWSITSDARIKENIVTLGNGLQTIMALRPVEFDYIETKKHDISFIAQEFKEVLPDQVVKHAANPFEKELVGEDEIYGLNTNLVPYLVKAIQELKAEFDAYKATHP